MRRSGVLSLPHSQHSLVQAASRYLALIVRKKYQSLNFVNYKVQGSFENKLQCFTLTDISIQVQVRWQRTLVEPLLILTLWAREPSRLNNGIARFKNVNNCGIPTFPFTQRHLVVKTLIYIEMLFIFTTPVSIRHLCQLKTVVFLHGCLICTVQLTKILTKLF